MLVGALVSVIVSAQDRSTKALSIYLILHVYIMLQLHNTAYRATCTLQLYNNHVEFFFAFKNTKTLNSI